MNCPKCGAPMPETVSFCTNCGTPMPKTAPAAENRFCTNCGAALAPGATVCSACGTPCGGAVPVTPVTPPRTPARTPMAVPPPRSGGNKGLLIGGIIAAVVLVLILAGVAVTAVFAGSSGKEPAAISEAVSSSEVAPDIEPTATPEPTADSKPSENVIVEHPMTSAATATPEPTPAPTAAPAQTAAPTAAPVAPAQNTASEYVFPHSDSQYLTDADLSGLDATTLRIARNEILARHGRLFDSEDLQTHFNGCSWYHGTISPTNFSFSVLNSVELANIELIKAYEGN